MIFQPRLPESSASQLRAAVLLAAFFLAALSAGPATAQVKSTGPDAAVITVGKEVIKRGQIETLVGLLEKQGGKPAPLAPGEKHALRQMVATNLIGQELIGLEARRLKISARPHEIDSAYHAVRAAYPDEQQFRSALLEAGDNEKSLKQKLARQIVQEKLLDLQVPPPAMPPEAEMRKFFAENKAEFPENDSLRACQVVLLVPSGSSGEEAEKKRRKLEDIRRRLAGDSLDFPELLPRFMALAAETSESPAEKQRGGDLDRFAPSDFRTEFSKQVKKLEVGEMSPVFRTPLGWHLVLLTEKFDGKYENYRHQIARYLMAKDTMEKSRTLRDYLRSLARRYPVKYLDPAYRDTSASAVYKL